MTSFGNRLEYQIFVGANFAMVLIAHLLDYSHENELSYEIIWRCLKILHKHRLGILVKNMLQQPVYSNNPSVSFEFPLFKLIMSLKYCYETKKTKEVKR